LIHEAFWRSNGAQLVYVSQEKQCICINISKALYAATSKVQTRKNMLNFINIVHHLEIMRHESACCLEAP
jgi:hypothetical protein